MVKPQLRVQGQDGRTDCWRFDPVLASPPARERDAVTVSRGHVMSVSGDVAPTKVLSHYEYAYNEHSIILYRPTRAFLVPSASPEARRLTWTWKPIPQICDTPRISCFCTRHLCNPSSSARAPITLGLDTRQGIGALGRLPGSSNRFAI